MRGGNWKEIMIQFSTSKPHTTEDMNPSLNSLHEPNKRTITQIRSKCSSSIFTVNSYAYSIAKGTLRGKKYLGTNCFAQKNGVWEQQSSSFESDLGKPWQAVDRNKGLSWSAAAPPLLLWFSLLLLVGLAADEVSEGEDWSGDESCALGPFPLFHGPCFLRYWA